MRSALARVALLVAAVLVAAGLLVVAEGGPAAQAAPPGAGVATQTAARPFAAGGPAASVPVFAALVAPTPDGGVVYWDGYFKQIRRVSGSPAAVSVVAGNGATADSAPLDTADPAADAPLPTIEGLWTDEAGDVVVKTCARACQGTQLWRLDAADGHWHFAVGSPPPTATGAPSSYSGFAVEPDGSVVVTDDVNGVVRRFARGDDPDGGGTVIAGTPGRYGNTGDGGPATGALVTPTGPIAAGPDGSVYIATAKAGGIRRIDPAGTIATVAVPAVASQLSEQVSIDGLATSSDGSRLYLLQSYAGGRQFVRAVPLGDPTATVVVAGPCPADTTHFACIGPSIAGIAVAGAEVVVGGQGALRAWLADGSAAQAPSQYAGIDDSSGSPSSPDGTTLDAAFTDARAVAAAPDGGVALVTQAGIRTLSGLGPSSTIGTLAPTVHPTWLQYAHDGTLYAQVSTPTPEVIALSPAGAEHVVLGGGSDVASAGASGTSVALPVHANVTVDPATGDLYFDNGQTTDSAGNFAENLIWRLDPSGVVQRFADVAAVQSQAGDLAVAPDHSVYVDNLADGLGHVGADGSVARVDCHVLCPTTNLRALAAGVVVGRNRFADTLVLGPDGAVQSVALSGGGDFDVTSDGRILGVAGGYSSGGLLAYSAPLPAPPAGDQPSVTTTPIAGGVTVSVTPAAGDRQVTIMGGAQDQDGRWLGAPETLDTLDTTSGAAVSRTYRHLFTSWPAQPGGTPPTFRFEAVALENDASGLPFATAPVVAHARPLPDTTAPGSPTLTLRYPRGNTYDLAVTVPSDADLDRVVVCRSAGATPLARPWGCDEVGETTSDTTLYNVQVDPRIATTFTAFALDASGNASAPVSATRSAPGLVSGEAITGIGYAARPGTELITWPLGAGAADYVRYTSGTVPPAGPTDGAAASEDQGGAYYASLPVSSGKSVAVSLFTWADEQQSTFRRTSFVLREGASSDRLAFAASSAVAAGKQASLVASVTRAAIGHGTASPLADATVCLYRRPVGAVVWTQIGVSCSATGSDGRVRLAAPVQTANTDYQARYLAADGRTVLATSAAARTALRPYVTAQIPPRMTHGRTATVTYRVLPGRSSAAELQQYVRGRWVRIATGRSTSSGSGVLRYRSAARGEVRLRVVIDASAAALAAVSGAQTVAIS